MFKKDLTPAPKQKLKSSVQRSLRQTLQTTYPLLTPYMDEVLPRKASLSSIKLPDRHTLFVLDDNATTSATATTPVFFQLGGSGALMPHLRLVHRFPGAFPSVRIDRGAIRFVLSGATLMAPGLTSAGGRLPLGGGGEKSDGREKGDGGEGEEGGEREEGGEGEAREYAEDGSWSRELEKGEAVVVMAEGKSEACAVGVLVAGTAEVKEKGKGPVIEEAHYLGDGLWNLNLD